MMKHNFCCRSSIIFPVLLITVLTLTRLSAEQPDVDVRTETRHLIVMLTSDLHGHLAPWNFFTGKEEAIGLAAVANLVQSERKNNPRLLLLDAGDTIQGSPLVWLYARKRFNEPNPMAVIMNAMGYTAMTVGNHEFNFGRDVLDSFIRDANFPVLSANITNEDGSSSFLPYSIESIDGIKIGILGLTTTGIPLWEKPEHIAGLRFEDAVSTARRYIPEMQAQGATILIALVHAGTHLTPPENLNVENPWLADVNTWQERGLNDSPSQNFVIPLAFACPEFDVIFAAHNHVIINESFINGVLITEPGSFGTGVSRVELHIDRSGKVIRKSASFVSTEGVTADHEITRLVEPYQSTAIAMVNEPIGKASAPFPGGFPARWRDGPLADFINTVQFSMAQEAGYQPDVSATAIFNDAGSFNEGPISMADIYRIYQYENTLYLLEIDGDILRRALEHAALFWKTIDSRCPPQTPEELIGKGAKPYNWDLFSGVDYHVDLEKPPGHRIVSLTKSGCDVTPDQKFILAINNYRAAGGGGYTMYREGKLLWQSTSGIRDAIVDYLLQKKEISPQSFFQENWKILLPDVVTTTWSDRYPEFSAEPYVMETTPTNTFFIGFFAIFILVNLGIAVSLIRRLRTKQSRGNIS